MVHRKKVYQNDYSSHVYKLEQYVPREIENALVISADEGAVPVWLFQNRPAFVTILSFIESEQWATNLENNLEEFSHSLARLEGKHLESLQVLTGLSTRYDFIFLNTVDSDCSHLALKLLATDGVLIFQEHDRSPQRTEDFRDLLGKNQNAFELITSQEGQWVIRRR